MKKVWLILSLFGNVVMSNAQGVDSRQLEEPCPMEKPVGKSAGVQQMFNVPARGYDVIKYSVFLDWRRPLDSMKRAWPGSNEITVVLTSALSELVFDAGNMLVDSTWKTFDTVRAGSTIRIDTIRHDTTWRVNAFHIDTARVNGIVVATTQPDSTQSFKVQVDRVHAIGDTIVIRIAYTHDKRVNELGVFLYDKRYIGQSTPWNDSVFTPERMVYTMSEPRDAKWWMPCNDDPADKAQSAEIRVLVPAGYSVSSNGRLQSANSSEGGAITWYWKEDEPISTYLMCASASKFAISMDRYVRFSNPLDTVPLMNFTWRVDSASSDISGRAYNAAYAFRNTAKIMEGYSRRFGEFPFSKYGMTPAQPFGYGGMEHQTMTTINRLWLRGADEMYIGHEMTHQWFGDNVTCATWKDIWLNEGFATFGEAIYQEWMNGTDAYINEVKREGDDYKNTSASEGFLVAVYDPEGQGKNVFNYATVYRKGGAVLHMLRRVLGDSTFFATLQAYQAHFRFGNATTDDFANFISQNTGQDLHWFINEWIYGHGHPQYFVHATVRYSTVIGHDRIHVSISQVDSLNRPLFRMPVTLRVYFPQGSKDFTATDSMQTQDFDIPFAVTTHIDSVAFDPENSILKEQTILVFDEVTGISSPGDQPLHPSLSLFVAPNPVQQWATISWAASSASTSMLEIFDVMGRSVEKQVRHDGANSVQVDMRSLPAGMYTARVTSVAGTCFSTIRVVH